MEQGIKHLTIIQGQFYIEKRTVLVKRSKKKKEVKAQADAKTASACRGGDKGRN